MSRSPLLPPCDVLVLGTGAAGLTLALRLAEDPRWRGRPPRIVLVAKGPLREGATLYAQGGISVVWDEADSVEAHIADTLAVGAGLCDPEVVRFTVERGRAAVQWLVDQGVPFTTETRADGTVGYHLAQEGGHSRRRIIHAADATGREVELTLEGRARRHPAITVLEHHLAVDLAVVEGRCAGAHLLPLDGREVRTLPARCVVLATGGAGKVYLYTSNPDVATGDGIAMAWRAGCQVANLEFFQFHPTCLYHPQAKSFLLTEALRGEGARLLLPDGRPFLHRYHPRGELAPRDVVARAIDQEMKRLGLDCVYLDISHRDPAFVRSHFPTVHRRCLEFGYDLTREPVPVVPAAHYCCGGVVTDLSGETGIPNLFAAGEVACTGLHGANRLASNSLLEAVVFADTAADAALARFREVEPPLSAPPWEPGEATVSDEAVVISQNWDEIRRFMWNYVGIVRSDRRLERARRRIDLLQEEITEYYWNFVLTPDLVELRNLATVAEVIIRSAQSRKESRGLHHNVDHPETDDRRHRRDTLIRRS